MNKINRINSLNQTELSLKTPFSQSWHNDFIESNYIHINHLDQSIKVKDLLIIFSQYGIPTHVKLLSNFAFLKYENWLSCVLAIDNLQGIEVFGKKLVVDHCWFKLKNGETEDDFKINYAEYVPQIKELTHYEEIKEATGVILKKDSKAHNQQGHDNKKRTLEEDEFKDPMADFIGDQAYKIKHSNNFSGGHKSRRHKHGTRNKKSDDN